MHPIAKWRKIPRGSGYTAPARAEKTIKNSKENNGSSGPFCQLRPPDAGPKEWYFGVVRKLEALAEAHARQHNSPNRISPLQLAQVESKIHILLNFRFFR